MDYVTANNHEYAIKKQVNRTKIIILYKSRKPTVIKKRYTFIVRASVLTLLYFPIIPVLFREINVKQCFKYG